MLKNWNCRFERLLKCGLTGVADQEKFAGIDILHCYGITPVPSRLWNLLKTRRSSVPSSRSNWSAFAPLIFIDFPPVIPSNSRGRPDQVYSNLPFFPHWLYSPIRNNLWILERVHVSKVEIEADGPEQSGVFSAQCDRFAVAARRRVIEELGFYDPRSKDAAKQFVAKLDRCKHWLDVGAMPSETVSSLLKKSGLEHKHLRLPKPGKPKPAACRGEERGRRRKRAEQKAEAAEAK